MNRFLALIAAIMLLALAMLGCSNGTNPLTPGTSGGSNLREAAVGQAWLWDSGTVYIDLEAQTAEAVSNRSAMYTTNINTFLNMNPATLGFAFNNVDKTSTHVDVDMDVSISHPIPDKPQFNGYDVRAVLITDAGGTLAYDASLAYPVNDTNQYLLNADGFTRWYNKVEFTTPGLFGYLHGLYGSQNLTGDATLNPYIYFADGLGAADDLPGFLLTNSATYGVFSSGTTNTRNFQIRFPIPTPAVQYDYSITANWAGATVHPANAPEAVATSIDVTDDLYFVDATNFGGSIITDFTLFCWGEYPSAIYIESNILDNVYQLSPTEMTPTSEGDNWGRWSVEIPADTITSTEGNAFWVIAEFDPTTYSNPFGIPNSVQDEILTAVFRRDLVVANTPFNLDPVCDVQLVTAMPVTGDPPVQVEFDATGSYDPDAGDTLTYEWDFDADGSYGDLFSGDPDNPIHDYTASFNGLASLRLSDGNGGESTCSVLVDVTVNNVNPVCNVQIIGPNPAYGYPSAKVFFDASGSSDANTGDVLTFEWDFDGGGYAPGLATELHDYATDYDGPVWVKVSDGNGGESECSIDVVAMANTLYYYDGNLNDGLITRWTDGPGLLSWQYCHETFSWDENLCNPYYANHYSIAMTPPIEFPDAGAVSSIRLEIEHWGDMQNDGQCYGDLGVLGDFGSGLDFESNRTSERLVYISGFDFNDGANESWSLVFGDSVTPETSLFDCTDYASNLYSIGFEFTEDGAGNPSTQEGWNIRKLKVYVVP